MNLILAFRLGDYIAPSFIFFVIAVGAYVLCRLTFDKAFWQ